MPRSSAARFARILSPEQLDDLGIWPDEDEPRFAHVTGKAGVFREKAHAGMQGIAAAENARR